MASAEMKLDVMIEAALHNALQQFFEVIEKEQGIMVTSVDVDWLDCRSALNGNARVQRISITARKVFA